MAQALRRRTAIGNLQISSSSSLYSFSIKPSGENFVLVTNNHPEFAVLDTATINKLAALKDMALIHFEALAECIQFSKRQKQGSNAASKVFPVSINVFGPKSAAPEVAARLTRLSGYLQHPRALPPTVEYHNAQFFRFPEIIASKPNMNDFVGLGSALSLERKTKISAEIQDALDSISNVTAEGDYESPPGLLSKLTKSVCLVHHDAITANSWQIPGGWCSIHSTTRN